MLTKNFYRFVEASLSSGTYEFRLTDGSFDNKPRNTPALPFDVMNKPIYAHSSTGVCFGTGTTPATVDDYQLESIITSSMNVTITGQTAVSYSRKTDYDEYFTVFSIANKSTEAITISEIGLIAAPYYSSNYYLCLVDRTVLDAPITIPAGESKQITYTIRFNYGA